MDCASAKNIICPAPWGSGEGPKGLSLSVNLSRYLLVNHWTKSNKILCVICSHIWGVQQHIFLPCPPPCCPGEGRKRSNIIKFQKQSQFQRFLNQNLYVSSQMTYQMGFSFSRLGHAPGMGLGGNWVNNFFLKFNHIWRVSYSHEWHVQQHNVLGTPLPGALRISKKVNYHLFHLQRQFQRFLSQTLCFFSQMQDIKHITSIDVSFIWSPGSYPRVELRSAEESRI